MSERRRFFPATPVQQVPGRTVELEMQLRAVPAAVPAATAAELPRFVADLWRKGDQLMVLYSDGDTAAIDLCCAPAQDVTLWWANEYPGEPPAGYSAAASGSYNATAPGMPPTLPRYSCSVPMQKPHCAPGIRCAVAMNSCAL